MASFEDIKDAGGMANRGSELLKGRRDRLKNKSVDEIRLLQRIADDQKKVDELLNNLEMGDEERRNRITSISAGMNEMHKLANQLGKARTYGANKMFAQGVGTALGSRSTNEDINRNAGSATSFGGALSMAQSMGTADIENIAANSRRAASLQSGRIAKTAANIEGNEWQFDIQMGARQGMLTKAAQAQAALQVQKRLGIDTQSQYYSAAETTRNVVAQQQKDQIRQEASVAKPGDRKAVEQEINNIGKQLVETFSQLDEAVRNNSKEADGLLKSFKTLEGEFSKKQSLVNEMKGQGTGGDGGGDWLSKFTNFGAIVGNMGTIGAAATEAYRYTTVTSEMDQRQVQAGMAREAGVRFTDAIGATRNDARSLRRVATNAFGDEAAFGRLMGGKESNAMQGQTGSQTLMATGAGINKATDARELIKEGVTLGGNSANYATSVAAAAAPGASQAWQSGVNLAKGISPGQAMLRGMATAREKSDAENEISDQLRQQSQDFSLHMGGATRGLGGNRTGVMSPFMNPTALMGLQSRTGMTQAEIAHATTSGVNELGSEFKGMSDVSRGGSLARTGYMQSSEQYMQARGALSGVGGGANNLEQILKSAVANGMDSSKNIMQMVQATTEMASRSANMGVGTAGGSANVLGRGVDALVGQGVSKNMAVGAAATAANVANESVTGQGLDLKNTIRFGQLKKQFPNAKPWELDSLARLSLDQIAQLKQTKDPGKFKQLTQDLGVGSVIKDQAGVNAVGDVQSQAGMTGILGFGADAELDRRARAGDKSPEVLNYINARTKKTGASGVGTFAALDVNGTAKQSALRSGPGGEALNAENQRAAGAISEAKMFADGIKEFAKMHIEFKTIGSAMKEIATKLDPHTMAAAQKESSDKMGVPTSALSGKVDTFASSITQATIELDKFKTMLKAKIMDNVNSKQNRK